MYIFRLLRSVYRYENYWVHFIETFSSNPEEDLNFAPPIGMNNFLLILYSLFVLHQCT